jgi:hypothetical protein
MYPTYRAVREELWGGDFEAASTFVGVTSLAFPGLLIEIQAVAVTDDER